MGAVRIKAKPGNSDPLMDEVRENRRKLVTEFHNDLDQLAEHLQKVHVDYENRAGQFADVPKNVDAEMFPTMSSAVVDPTHEEVQKLRNPLRNRTLKKHKT